MKITGYDFSGWATRNDLKCSDGRVIRKNAFKHNDGQSVPLVWNHQHNTPDNVLGHAILENREEGVYAYGFFNDTKAGEVARTLVKHKDICALSIYANQLKQNGSDVVHGQIREVSLVHAGANPGAFIDSMLNHSEESEDEAIVYTGFELTHADKSVQIDKNQNEEDDEEEPKMGKEKTIGDIIETMNQEQKDVMYGLIGAALEEKDNDMEDEEDMKHNIFDRDMMDEGVLSHGDMDSILKMAKTNSIGTFQTAMNIFAENSGIDVDAIQHGFSTSDTAKLFPDYYVAPGAPMKVMDDQGWVAAIMKKSTKSPFSRIRTRQVDVREQRALGFKQGQKKKDGADLKLITRTTDPQTVYRKDSLKRDDIIDITDFDVVAYQYEVMKVALNEEIARAALIGDGRDDGAEEKIQPEHIRPIWLDDELYTIHKDVDLEAVRAELQGTNTAANFGTNYIYTEAIIQASLYAREEYRGSGTPDLFCTPRMLNMMLLARDMNGRRIYSSKSELASALNVNEIYTVEAFEGQKRTDKSSQKHKLLGIFVNMADYQFGSTKGGEITKFNQFDIDFNQEKYLIETRLSGALTKVASAIAIEEKVD